MFHGVETDDSIQWAIVPNMVLGLESLKLIPNISMTFWHVAKSITKEVLRGSKEKGCEILKDWAPAIKTHLYWCATSTTQGFGNLIVAKWRSFTRHVCDKHEKHPDELYPKCAHTPLTQRRKWIKYCKWFTKEGKGGVMERLSLIVLSVNALAHVQFKYFFIHRQ